MNIFAVVCHGNAKGLLDATKEFGAKCSCLYNYPVDPNIFRNAPFLVEINEGIKPWLAELKEPWGIYLITEKEVSFNEMRKHLRRFTYVQTPIQESPILFRYYDPRVFWRFVDVIDDDQLYLFLGKIVLVASNYLEFKEAHFDDRRKKGRYRGFQNGYLTLSQSQIDRLDGFYAADYVEALKQYIFNEVDWEKHENRIEEEIGSDYTHLKMLKHQKDIGRTVSHPLDLELLSREDYFMEKMRVNDDRDNLIFILVKSVFIFLSQNKIKDDRSIKAFLLLIVKSGFLYFEEIPPSILSFLENSSIPEKNRVSALLDKVLESKLSEDRVNELE